MIDYMIHYYIYLNVRAHHIIIIIKKQKKRLFIYLLLGCVIECIYTYTTRRIIRIEYYHIYVHIYIYILTYLM